MCCCRCQYSCCVIGWSWRDISGGGSYFWDISGGIWWVVFGTEVPAVDVLAMGSSWRLGLGAALSVFWEIGVFPLYGVAGHGA